MISNNAYIKIVKIIPINYELKSDLEKEAILNAYQAFLKCYPFDLQILIQSKKESLDSCIFQIENQIEEEKNNSICKIANNYINYLKDMNNTQNSSSKNFYILISSPIENNEFNMKEIREDLINKYLKLKDTLSRCGNLIFEIDNRKDVEKILYSFYNFRKSLKFI